MDGYSPEDDERRESGISLDRILSVVRRRAHVVAMITGLTGGMAVAIAWMLPNSYDASAIVQIDPRKKTIANLDSVISDLKADSTTVDSEVEIVRSRAISLKVIDKLALRDDTEFTKPTALQNLWNWLLRRNPKPDKPAQGPTTREQNKDPIARILGSDEPGAAQPERDPVAVAFAERLKVTRVRNTLLIEIRFSSADPVKAAKIANTIAEYYLQDQTDAKQRAAELATSLLEEKIAGIKDRVTDAERKIARYRAANNIFKAGDHELGEQQLARLMEQTVNARNATAEAKAKYEQVRRMLDAGDAGDDTTEVLASHTVRLLKEEYAKATRKEAELLTRYGPKHPEMLKARAEVADASAQLKAEITKLVGNLKNEFEVAEARERQLNLSLANLKDSEASSKENDVDLKELERNAQTEKQLLEALLTRYKQTAETQSLQLPDSRIVEQADVPLFPASPKRKQMVLIGVLGGLFGGIALVLALEFLTTGLARPEDVEGLLEVAHLGSVPDLGQNQVMTTDPVLALRLMLAEPRGAFADAIRSARREIDMRAPHEGPRILAVAASLPNEGSDVIASNLAHHYALSGKRVLLVDADLRRGALTRRLAAGRTSGLLDVLSQGLPVESAILRDAATGLNFLPAMGPAPLELSSPEVLGSSQMATIFSGLKRQFDVIVLDLPPLLPVIDGRILADQADQMVFVMTWRGTPKQLAKRALKCLGANQAKLAGAIVNQVEPAILEESQGYKGLDYGPGLRAA